MLSPGRCGLGRERSLLHLQRQLVEMAAQAAFDRKLSHYRNEIGEFGQQGIHYRPLCVQRTGGRIQPSYRTLQYAQAGSICRRKSLHRRWKHEIEITLLRRRAAMARAVLPNPSSFSSGRVALRRHHRQSSAPLGSTSPLLDGGASDHDLDDF